MPTVVPKSAGVHGQERLVEALEGALEALLEVIGATAGCVSLVAPPGQLHLPVIRGEFSPTWLAIQAGRTGWGISVGSEPGLINSLPLLPFLGKPPLANLLFSPVVSKGVARGHLLLANKPAGFTSHDSSILLGFAHLVGKWLTQLDHSVSKSIQAPSFVFHSAFERVAEGAILIGPTGSLVYANERWANWSGFKREELLQRSAPYPFWISLRQLLALESEETDKVLWLLSSGATQSSDLGLLPFRHRNGQLFWCHAEQVIEDSPDGPISITYLRRKEPSVPKIEDQPSKPGSLTLESTNSLPFAVGLTDHAGKVIWSNSAFSSKLASAGSVVGRPLRDFFRGPSVATLEHFFRSSCSEQQSQLGRLVLERGDTALGEGLIAYWFALTLTDGQGYLFALNTDWEALLPVEDLALSGGKAFSRPGNPQLALLIQPGAEIQFWDERWQALTGLGAEDLNGLSTDVVLDWLFPRQADRDRVADLLGQDPPRRPAEFVLDVVGAHGNRPLRFAFLPVVHQGQESWLLLAGTPESISEVSSALSPEVRRFARGLSHVLNHSLSKPLGLAEMAADRGDFPPAATEQFVHIQQSCQQLTTLIGLLQDLGATSPGDLRAVPLGSIVREFLNEHASHGGQRSYELKVDIQDEGAGVRVNRRMLKTVLGQVLSNAEEAVAHSPLRQIEVRVMSDDAEVWCEIEDTGEGLVSEDWSHSIGPFHSTKGAFASDPVHALQGGAGLGLTVSQHLLSLQGGRLELRAHSVQGTTATIILPRSRESLVTEEPVEPVKSRARADSPSMSLEPHAISELTKTPQPPLP